MRKYFGTDGIRRIANTELTPELVYKVAKAGAYVLSKHTDHTPTILIGRDTRISGTLIEIAELKMPDLNAASLEAAMSMIAGTARSMGITVEE